MREEKRQYAMDFIKDHAAEYFTKDKSKKGYICPICGSGSGKSGTGITENPNSAGHYTCWAGCFTNEDIFGIVQKEKHCDFNTAFNLLCDFFGIKEGCTAEGITRQAAQNTETEQVAAEEELERIKIAAEIEEYAANNTEGCAGDIYLTGRGISTATQRMYKIGYCPKWKAAPNAPAASRVIIPTGKHSYLARAIAADTPKEYRAMARGKKAFFNAATITESTKPVFVVEGEIDALSFIECGYSAVSLGSVAMIKKFAEYCEENKPAVPLIIALDNDDAGRKSQAELLELLKAKSIVAYAAADWLYSSYKDANEVLQKEGKMHLDYIARKMFADVLTLERDRKKSEEATTAKPEEINAQQPLWPQVEKWAQYYIYNQKADLHKIISLIQPKVAASGIDVSAGEVAQHIAKYWQEQGNTEQIIRAGLFKTPTTEQALAAAERARRTHGQLFKFGISGLDDFGGVCRGEMLSVFGNPQSWKTALVTNGIRNWLDNGGGKVLLFELDMGRDVMFDRLISSRLQVPAWKLRELHGTEGYENAKAEITAFCEGDGIGGARFEIIDRYDAGGNPWTLETVIEAIERKAPAVVCIDYLTLLKTKSVKDKPVGDYEIANTAIDALYDIAKTYGIIVITLSQMSMESRRIQAQGGSGGTAKGGGKVEERSDAVIELFKDSDSDGAGNITSDIIATIRKARNNEGATGYSYKLTHSYGRFNSIADKVVRKKKKLQKMFETVRSTWAGY